MCTQDSLGGNSKVLMFVNISPAAYNVGETICSLNFAARCRYTTPSSPCIIFRLHQM
jgi:hypothetical protein